MASTHTTSSSVKPAAGPSSALPSSALPARDVLRGACSTFCSIRTVREDVIGSILSGRAVDVRIAPRIGRHDAALEIRPVPGRDVGGLAHQRGKSLRAARIAPGVEIIQIERAGEAFDLDLGSLALR